MDIAKNNFLAAVAIEDCENQCLWTRALLPSSCWKVAEDNQQTDQIGGGTPTTQIGQFTVESGAKVVGTDGSGGLQSTPSELRKVDMGAATVEVGLSDPQRPFRCKQVSVIMERETDGAEGGGVGRRQVCHRWPGV